MKKAIVIIGLIGLMGNAWGQATATLSPDTIKLGDQCTLLIEHSPVLPTSQDLSQNGIIALGQKVDSTTGAQVTLLTCFEPGVHFLKLGPDDSLALTVLDVEVDTTSVEIRDIGAIEKVPYTFWEIFRWVLLAYVIVALSVLGWWLYTHRKRLGEVLGTSAPADTRTPEQRALDSLEALRRRQLWQTGKTKEYHTELTDIVRRFIEEATGIRATDMTSDETLEAMQSGKWGVDCGLLRNIFTTADLVKFAKSEPLPHEHDRSMSQAVEFVKQLWLMVKPAESAEPDKKDSAQGEEAAHA